MRAMEGPPPPPFLVQRVVCFALVLSITTYAIIAGVVLQTNGGEGLMEQPPEGLGTFVWAGSGVALLGSVTVRLLFTARASGLEGNDRGRMLFLARLAPIALLEMGCLFAITAWMLDGQRVPGLALACVQLALAIALVPLRDPDAPADT